MNIDVSKMPISVKEIRKNKLKQLKNKKWKQCIGYNWNLRYTETDDTLQDFHLFCISITRDLIENRFETNERGKFLYDDINDMKTKRLYKDINELFDIVLKDKIKSNANKNK